jgi:type IV secretory pathway VirB10-like protein
MRQSGRTTLFVLICIAVLTAAYGVGLGVKKMREAGIKIHISMPDDTEKLADKTESKPAEPVTPTVVATPAPDQDEPVVEAVEEKPETKPAQAQDADLEAKKQWFQNLSEEEQQEMIAKKRASFAGKGRSEGRGAFQQLSEEDRADFRAKMEALGAKAGDMSEEEMREARAELMQEYGINPQRRGGRRSGARQ